MKDHILIGHLTKINTFNVNRGQAMDLETWFKIQTSLILRQQPKRPPSLLVHLLILENNILTLENTI